MIQQYPLLFSPLTLRGHTLQSRAVFTAHTVTLSTDGVPGDRARGYYEARAAGGVGLIVMEPIPVLANGGVIPQNYRYQHPGFVAGLRSVVDAVHRHGTIFVCQLYHMGSNADPYSPWSERWGPSAMQGAGASDVVRPIDEFDIDYLVNGYVAAAKAAIDGGADGIECMFAYDTLVDQFMDPKRNERTDHYGGSLPNRCRLAVRILHELRAVVGSQALLGITVSAAMQEHVEAVSLLGSMCDLDYVGVGNGNYERLHLTIPPMEVPVGIGVLPAASLRSTLGRLQPSPAVIAEGRIRTAALAEDALASGACDLVGMTRALIADPELLLKSRSGHAERVRECVGYNLCIARRLRKYPVACVQNPIAGLEHEQPFGPLHALTKSNSPRQVIVVGAGLSGLEAARVAAERGHRVLVLERSGVAGGQASLIGRLPLQTGFAELVDWRVAELARLKVELRFNVDVTANSVAALIDPPSDPAWPQAFVVVATGSTPTALPGSIAAADALLGATIAGETVIVIDGEGHRKGVGTAEWLALRGHRVTLVAVNGSPAAMLDGSKVGPLAMGRLADLGVQLVEGHRLVGVDGGEVRLLRSYDGAALTLLADSVVHATPHTVNDALVDPLRRAGINVRAVGDARTPRLVEDAIRDGYGLATTL